MSKENEMQKQWISIMTKELPVLRKINNLTQKGLGEVVGVSRQTITNIESGRNEMKWSLFLSLMFVFSLDQDSNEYLRSQDFPYADIVSWLKSKRMWG